MFNIERLLLSTFTLIIVNLKICFGNILSLIILITLITVHAQLPSCSFLVHPFSTSAFSVGHIPTSTPSLSTNPHPGLSCCVCMCVCLWGSGVEARGQLPLSSSAALPVAGDPGLSIPEYKGARKSEWDAPNTVSQWH